MKQYETTKFLDGFVFLEGPRWHDGALWVSDMMGLTVYRIDADGHAQVIASVPERPSGLGFLPDGTPLVVSMLDRRLYKIVDGALELHADCAATVSPEMNDMVVDRRGRAYIGNFGYDIFGGADPDTAEIVLVEADGSHRIVADGLECPNGTVISADGRTLIVAETFAGCLTAFDIEDNGNLVNRRVHSRHDDRMPDGICLDADGNIWVAEFLGNRFVQVDPGGNIIASVDVGPASAIAPQLGGDDGRTLFCLVYAGDVAAIAAGKPGAQILTAHVDVAGAGSP